ncbi:MAG: hypothetical protein H6577_25160 [Lewinellaceae bacterium]|nr:hypothetical protein [Saprospiraceae bacterium]MCB9341428.1 hypothetical protein [Lewinellaceae bacterium]
MIDNTVYLQITAPKPHQRIIGKLMMRLGILYYDENKIPFEPFPETMIDENQTSPTPDILLYDNETKTNQIIIEVTGNTGLRKDIEKVKQLVEDYGVPEGFVYNYNTGKWYKYQLGKGEDIDTPSFSHLLHFDLDKLLDR